MYDFSNLSDNELAKAFVEMAQIEGAWGIHVFRAAAVELTTRIHAVAAPAHYVVNLGA